MAVGGALFSGGGGAAPASKALVEFRAGKMNLSGTTVTPDKRKGLVMVEQGDDDLMHFKWKDRTSGNVEDDLIIFPDDIEFKRVAQCTTGRVYILKFKSSSRKLFFWMQEPKEDKDEEFCKKVNDFLNNPPAAGSSGSGRSSAGNVLAAAAAGIPGLDIANLRDSELQNLLNHMSRQQLMQLFGEVNSINGQSPSSGSSTSTRQRASARPTSATSEARAATATAPAVAAATATTSTASKPSTSTGATAASSKAPIQLSDLQSILSGIKVPPGEGAAGASGPEVDLSSGLSLDVMQPLLANPEFVRKMKDLLPQVPGDEERGDAVNEIKGTVQSPQFKQALSLFSSGLQTGQLAPLIREFELGDDAVAAAAAGDMEAFVKALQKPTSEPKAESKDEEEGMDLD